MIFINNVKFCLNSNFKLNSKSNAIECAKNNPGFQNSLALDIIIFNLRFLLLINFSKHLFSYY